MQEDTKSAAGVSVSGAESSFYSEAASEDVCEEHSKKLEIICIQDKMRICSTCALFGFHKGHDVRMADDVIKELDLRTEYLISMY